MEADSEITVALLSGDANTSLSRETPPTQDIAPLSPDTLGKLNLEKYQIHDGVPCIVQKAEDMTRLTSYCLSDDGLWLATLDQHSRILLHRTSDFKSTSVCFSNTSVYPLNCISFVLGRNDRLRAVDSMGTLLEFEVHLRTRAASSQQPQTNCMTTTLEHWREGYQCAFVANGRILRCQADAKADVEAQNVVIADEGSRSVPSTSNGGTRASSISRFLANEGGRLGQRRRSMNRRAHNEAERQSVISGFLTSTINVAYFVGEHALQFAADRFQVDNEAQTIRAGHKISEVRSDRGLVLAVLHEIDSMEHVKYARLASKQATDSDVILSENGRSAFVETINGEIVVVWPQLKYTNEKQQGTDSVGMNLVGYRATWGKEGEYLLLQGEDSVRRRPQLLVYQTEHLCSQSASAEPWKVRSIEYGLEEWNAIAIDHDRDGIGQEILIIIQEIDQEKKQRIFLWDPQADTVIRELLTTINPRCPTSVEDPETAEPSNRCLATWRRSRLSVFYPYVATLSLQHKVLSIFSLETGIELCNVTLPNSLEFEPELFIEAHFDLSGKHFLIIDRNCVFGIAPPFLYSECANNRKEMDIDCSQLTQNFLMIEGVETKLKGIPSEALADILLQSIPPQSIDRIQPTSSDVQRKYLKAALILSSTMELVQIEQKSTGEVSVDHVIITTDRSGTPDQKRMDYRLTVEDFEAEAAFLYRDWNSVVANFVLLGLSSTTLTAVFCDVSNSNNVLQRRLDLELPSYLCVYQADDFPRLIILHKHGVRYLDLPSKTISNGPQYKADIVFISELVGSYMNKSLSVRCEIEQELNGHTNRLNVSQDGQIVLLAWDIERRESLVLKPDTDKTTSSKQIQDAATSLSDICKLSRDGNATCYLEIGDILRGRFTVGVFDEQERTCKKMFSVRLWQSITEKSSALSDALRSFDFAFVGSRNDITIVDRGGAKRLENKPSARLHFFRHAKEVMNKMPEYKRLVSDVYSCGDKAIEEFSKAYNTAAVFNQFGPDHVSILHAAYINGDWELAKSIRAFIKDDGIQATVCWEPIRMLSTDSSMPRDILDCCFQRNVINEIEEAVMFLCSRSVSFVQAASVLKSGFNKLVKTDPEFVKRALKEDLFVSTLCELRVDGDLLDSENQQNSAEHIRTTDTVLEWLVTDSSNLERSWEEAMGETIHRTTIVRSVFKRIGILQAILIEDAANIGMNGIIRPLFMANMPEEIFACSAVKWVINYKWYKIWRERHIKKMISYLIFLMFYAAYVIVISASGDNRNRDGISAGLVVICACFGLQTTIDKVKMIVHYTKDGEAFLDDRFWGVKYFFGFGWSLMDIASCLLLVVFIPFLHTASLLDSTYDDALSVVVALEAIVISVKMWYFAHPFSTSGPLVLMVYNIAKDCLTFLSLALLILFGFALALHVLFRKAAHTNPEIKTAFGSFSSSMLTMFYAMLGDFNSDMFRDNGRLSGLTILTFVLYMIAQLIVLLNLLISIMGDTFDKVKSSEEAQFLMGRAATIDAGEAVLSRYEQEQIKKMTGKYIQSVSNIDEGMEQNDSELWQGRIRAIESCFKTKLTRTEQNLTRLVERQEAEIKRLANQLEGIRSEIILSQS